jgi:NADH:ubiquinone oxidoreductase subunit D
MGETGKISTSAKIYLSYYDVAGPMNVKNNMSELGTKTAIFWSIAKSETGYLAFEARSRNYIEAAPSNSQHVYYETGGGHLTAPSAAKDKVAEWIEKVSKH